MAKVNKLKQGLGSLKKKPIIAEEKSETIINKVHKKEVKTEVPKKRGRKKVNIEETTRYTIDIPESVYKAIKHRVADEGGTMKSFIMRTLKKELGI